MERAILSLTEPERVIMAVEAMEEEVNNGGYGQFFINSSKHFVPYIVWALQAIGCPFYGELAAKAIAELQLPSQFDGEDCDRAYMALRDKINSKLGELENLYYAGTEPIVERLFSYIERNKSEIRIPRLN